MTARPHRNEAMTSASIIPSLRRVVLSSALLLTGCCPCLPLPEDEPEPTGPEVPSTPAPPPPSTEPPSPSEPIAGEAPLYRGPIEVGSRPATGRLGPADHRTIEGLSMPLLAYEVELVADRPYTIDVRVPGGTPGGAFSPNVQPLDVEWHEQGAPALWTAPRLPLDPDQGLAGVAGTYTRTWIRPRRSGSHVLLLHAGDPEQGGWGPADLHGPYELRILDGHLPTEGPADGTPPPIP